ncbi:hypothetical protein KL941_002951 [Ogataea angusta]|nr:hypothetical protein KL941_002951 [Ogataea angusta]
MWPTRGSLKPEMTSASYGTLLSISLRTEWWSSSRPEVQLILVETSGAQEPSLALETYRKACSNERGAVLLYDARGKSTEGTDFDHIMAAQCS